MRLYGSNKSSVVMSTSSNLYYLHYVFILSGRVGAALFDSLLRIYWKVLITLSGRILLVELSEGEDTRWDDGDRWDNWGDPWWHSGDRWSRRCVHRGWWWVSWRDCSRLSMTVPIFLAPFVINYHIILLSTLLRTCQAQKHHSLKETIFNGSTTIFYQISKSLNFIK